MKGGSVKEVGIKKAADLVGLHDTTVYNMVDVVQNILI
jgi:hypothetical protein